MNRILLFIFLSELTLILRRSQVWVYPISFFVMVVCLFPLAFPDHIDQILPGCFWMTALFANLLSVQTLFYSDLEDGHLEQLFLSRHSFTLLLLPKLFAHWLATQLPFIFLTPLLAFLFHAPLVMIWVLPLTLLLGTPILMLLSAFAAALTLGLGQQGVLLGLIILPLAIPILIFGVNIVQQAMAGFSIVAPFLFLLGLCVLAITALPFTIAVTLRMSLEEG